MDRIDTCTASAVRFRFQGLAWLAAFLAAAAPTLCNAQAANFSVIVAPEILYGTRVVGSLDYSTGVVLRNTGGPVRYRAQATSLLEAQASFACCGFIPSFIFNFEMLNETTGAQETTLLVKNYADLTGPSGDLLFPTNADHLWNLEIASPGHAAGTVVPYTLIFRVYDVYCGFNLGYALLDTRCLAYQLPLRTGTISWIAPPPAPPAPPPPLAKQPVYPMINYRPQNANPPLTLPSSTFLYCDDKGCR